MEPRRRVLRMYGQPSDHAALRWDWVADELGAAGTYWVIARAEDYPHPRPVWGVWHEDELHLSIGSPVLRRAITLDPRATVHLESGTDVVIVEGLVAPSSATDPATLDAYMRKYHWDYQVKQYGNLHRLVPTRVVAWRAAGWAGRDSFQTTGCWDFGAT